MEVVAVGRTSLCGRRGKLVCWRWVRQVDNDGDRVERGSDDDVEGWWGLEQEAFGWKGICGGLDFSAWAIVDAVTGGGGTAG
jgi:hypothetical protein